MCTSRARFSGRGRRAGLGLVAECVVGAVAKRSDSCVFEFFRASVPVVQSRWLTILTLGFQKDRPLQLGDDQLQMLDLGVAVDALLLLRSKRFTSWRKAVVVVQQPKTPERFYPGPSSRQHQRMNQPSQKVCHRLNGWIDQKYVSYPADCGSHVLCGWRQSIPSNSIDNCARVRETVPLSACGHMNRPLSNRF